MKRIVIALMLLLVSNLGLAQKKEKIKGSTVVTTSKKKIGDFNAIEVSDNIEVFLTRGEKTEIKIEADDNLHKIIDFDLTAKTLRLSTTKTVYRFKRLIVRITYTDNLNLVTAKDESILNAIQEIQLPSITIKSQGKAELYLNVNTTDFTYEADENSETDLNLKSTNAIIHLSKNASLASLINATNLKLDMYEKSIAKLEGEVEEATIRLDNNADLDTKEMTMKNANLLTENYSKSIINASENFSLDATGSAEVQLYGEPKIEIKRFTNNVILSKKPSE